MEKTQEERRKGEYLELFKAVMELSQITNIDYIKFNNDNPYIDINILPDDIKTPISYWFIRPWDVNLYNVALNEINSVIGTILKHN